MYKNHYRVYSDGSHYIAYSPSVGKGGGERRKKDFIDNYFEMVYLDTIKQGLKPKAQFDYILNNFVGSFGEEQDFSEYIERNIERKKNNLFCRKKLFYRKAYLNKWNYFVTITYNDKKHTASSFRRKLKKCLSNLHTRYGYMYMGVFELSPNGRLHFHALMYIPKGMDLGYYNIKRDYSICDHKMQNANQNSFFLNKFGRNDFREFDPMELKLGNTISYLLKYLEKSGERVMYSRGIAAFLEMELPSSDIACSIVGLVMRYVLFDDVINSENNTHIDRARAWTPSTFLTDKPKN